MKINMKNTEKIEAAIKKAEEGCRARLIDIVEIQHAIKKVEDRLVGLGIPKKAWIGTTIVIDPPVVTNNYSGIPEGTKVEIDRFASGWFMTECGRVQCRRIPYGGDRRPYLVLSKSAKAAIPEKIEL